MGLVASIFFVPDTSKRAHVGDEWLATENESSMSDSGLVAYTYREKKPSLNIRVTEQLQLPALVF